MKSMEDVFFFHSVTQAYLEKENPSSPNATVHDKGANECVSPTKYHFLHFYISVHFSTRLIKVKGHLILAWLT